MKSKRRKRKVKEEEAGRQKHREENIKEDERKGKQNTGRR